MRRAVPLRYALAAAALCFVWQAGALALGPDILPSPGETFALFLRALGTTAFWTDMGMSTWRLALGLGLAVCVAFPAGLIMGHCRRADAVAAPLVFLTYPLPKIVLLPVFFTFLGLGDAPRVLLIALTTGYQILVIVRGTAMGLDPSCRKVFRSLAGTEGGVGRGMLMQALRHVYVPAALPGLFTSLKVAGGTAVAVLFLAESFATRSGLGFRIMDAWGRGGCSGNVCGHPWHESARPCPVCLVLPGRTCVLPVAERVAGGRSGFIQLLRRRSVVELC